MTNATAKKKYKKGHFIKVEPGGSVSLKNHAVAGETLLSGEHDVSFSTTHGKPIVISRRALGSRPASRHRKSDYTKAEADWLNSIVDSAGKRIAGQK